MSVSSWRVTSLRLCKRVSYGAGCAEPNHATRRGQGFGGGELVPLELGSDKL